MATRALLVDEDSERRLRLRQNCAEVRDFTEMTQRSSLLECYGLLDSTNRIDIVFLSMDFGIDAMQDFIARAKASRCARDAAFIVLLGNAAQDANTVGAIVLIGADGLLTEPYSVEALVNIVALAQRTKSERSDGRVRKALSLVVNDTAALIDLAAEIRRLGGTAQVVLRKAREKLHVHPSVLTRDENFYQILADTFEKSKPSEPLQVKVYLGASIRIRKRSEEKLVDRIQAFQELH